MGTGNGGGILVPAMFATTPGILRTFGGASCTRELGAANIVASCVYPLVCVGGPLYGGIPIVASSGGLHACADTHCCASSRVLGTVAGKNGWG